VTAEVFDYKCPAHYLTMWVRDVRGFLVQVLVKVEGRCLGLVIEIVERMCI
jgi:hypothetical protein